ncbi:MAG: efflux transporter periplasmic adaptor subunit [Planctomyces sp.]|nr:efflux transporter periplasmic adaptor subunit [Planctomyces sp.]
MTWRLIPKLIAGGLLLSLVIFWLLAGTPQTESAQAQPDGSLDRTNLMVVGAERLTKHESFEKERAFTGLVRAKRQSKLSFEVGGKVIECLVDEGSRVNAGDALARLESDRLEVQLKQTTAQLAQAQARLKELLAGPREQTINAKRDQVKELSALRDLARSKMDRNDKLHQRGAISEQERDNSYYDFLSLESRLSSTEQELNELLEGTREEQITAQKAVVQELEASQNAIEIDLQDAVLKAPFSGTIISRNVDEGEVVESGKVVFELIESDSLEIWVGVPVDLASQLMAHQDFTVEINGRRLPVERANVLPRLNRETRTQSVLFHFTDGADTSYIYSGQIARFHFAETVYEAGFWIPTDALKRGTRGLWSCYTLSPVDPEAEDVSPGVFELQRRDLEELYTKDGSVFVAGTLQEGDLLLSEGAHRVVQGDHVRLKSAIDPSSPIGDK